jgi:hypothetical protein
MVSSISSAGMGNAQAAQMAQMAQARAQMFKKSDADSSGGLNVDEFKALVAQGPGKAAPETSQLEEDFASFDADGDGSLTQTELDAGIETKMAEFRSTVDRFGGGPGGPGGPPPGPPPGEAEDSSDDSTEDDPLQLLMAALEGSDAKSQKVADQLRQLLQGLMDDGGASSSASSSLSVSA